jgi:hypothetical protein
MGETRGPRDSWLQQISQTLPLQGGSGQAPHRLRCASDFSALDCRDCFVPAATRSAVLVRGASVDWFLETAPDGGLCYWPVAFVAGGHDVLDLIPA